MARINHYVSLSEYYGIDPAKFDKYQIFDPLMTGDTLLFIDPLLFPLSSHKIVSENATQAFKDHFSRVCSLLRKCAHPGDYYWNTARVQLEFPEVAALCLGYGGANIRGRGSGKVLTEKLISAAKGAVDIGCEDPLLFPVLAVLEAGFGADRISDMTAIATDEALCQFTQETAQQIGIPVDRHFSRSGNPYQLPTNPFEKKLTPVFLLPLDILRKLPIANDWGEVIDAASENSELRFRVNRYIGDIFSAKTQAEKKDAKKLIKYKALSSFDALSSIIDMVREVNLVPYNSDSDPAGEIFWRKVAASIPSDILSSIKTKKIETDQDAIDVVIEIINKFKYWIEERRMSTELWDKDRNPRHEKSAQKIFFIVADQICERTGLDISPETDSGGGPVDFKFSIGYDKKIIVEIKLSINNKLLLDLVSSWKLIVLQKMQWQHFML
jgi:hypothetical protein